MRLLVGQYGTGFYALAAARLERIARRKQLPPQVEVVLIQAELEAITGATIGRVIEDVLLIAGCSIEGERDGQVR